MKIVEYKVLYEGGADTMTASVMAHINEGWQPLGGPQTHGAFMPLTQAMVKYAKQKSWFEAEPGKGTQSFGPG